MCPGVPWRTPRQPAIWLWTGRTSSVPAPELRPRVDLAICADQAPSQKWPPRGSRLAVTISRGTDTGIPSPPNPLGSCEGKKPTRSAGASGGGSMSTTAPRPHVWLSLRLVCPPGACPSAQTSWGRSWTSHRRSRCSGSERTVWTSCQGPLWTEPFLASFK